MEHIKGVETVFYYILEEWIRLLLFGFVILNSDMYLTRK